jgi:putative membrane protein
MDLSMFPSLNAGLNATSAIFLILGYVLIRTGHRVAHRACMLVSVTASSLFLISYLIYHYNVGTTAFPGQGWIRPVYFSILGTHTFFAIVIVPLVAVTLVRALRGRFALHKQIARWTFPIWLYVSVTGVVIYWLLYHVYPA